MSAREPRPPLVLHWLLRCVPLGEHRADVAADLTELFETRARSRGLFHASWRLCCDIASILANLLPARRGPSRSSSGNGASWLRDLRHGVRLFRKHPGVIGATVGGLSLAIAVSTTVFTILNATVIRPYGMDDPGSVVQAHMLVKQGTSTEWPYHAFAGLRERAALSRVEASAQQRVRFSLTVREIPTRVDAVLLVSGTYLQTLGGRAVLGRALQPADDAAGASPVVVLNHHFWTTRLNADPNIVGKTVWLSGSPVTVVGVLERAFTGPLDTPPAFWAPLASYGPASGGRAIDRSSAMSVSVIARLGAHVERQAAERDLSAIAAALPDVGIRNQSGELMPATGVQLDGASSPMAGADRAELLIIVSAVLLIVGLVLALACANVANLLLAGAAARAREIGIRLALGATRARILRQLLGESLVIGVVAGAAGLGLSLWLVPIVAAANGLPDTSDLRPDAMVLLFTVAMAIVSGAGAGLAPARYGSRGDLVAVLKGQGAQTSGPPAASRLRRGFIGFQAAASILLLATAALFLREALHITRVDIGFDANRLATVAAAFPKPEIGAPAVDAYWRSALEKARALPSVERASLALHAPFGGSITVRDLDRGGEKYHIYENRTDAEYFMTAGFRIVRGRGYGPDEVRAGAPVAVVSESLVRDFFSGADPVGSPLSTVAPAYPGVTIVGVVSDAITARVTGRGNGTIYRPLRPLDLADATLVIRSAQPAAIVRPLETALLALDPRVRPVATIMSDDVARFRNEPKILAAMSGSVAGLALILAVLGVYGVTTFVVNQRMWEVHVRQAIGASTHDIIRLLVRQSLTPVVIGLVAGLIVALGVVRLLSPVLSSVSPYDPPAILGAVGVLAVAGLAAVLSPALRAAHADPAAVLRQS